MLKRVARVWAVALVVWLPCSAQFDLRALTGVVVDKRGNTLKGAAVQIENSATLAVTSQITGKDGRYHFNLLNGDTDYTVKARYRRYWSRPKTLSKFNSSKHPEIDLVIPID
jgi:hypothetical protein